MKIVVFESFDFSSMDHLDLFLEKHGLPKETIAYSAVTPEILEQSTAANLVILLGSPASVNDIGTAWVTQMRSFVQSCFARGTKVLGICFGAQLIASVAGAEVSRLPSPRVGYRTIAGHGPVPWSGTWFCFHEDAIKAGADLDIVAEQDGIVYAFRHLNCLGVQFHPEMSTGVIRKIRAELAGDTSFGADLDTAIKNPDGNKLEDTQHLFDHIFRHELALLP